MVKTDSDKERKKKTEWKSVILILCRVSILRLRGFSSKIKLKYLERGVFEINIRTYILKAMVLRRHALFVRKMVFKLPSDRLNSNGQIGLSCHWSSALLI